MRAQEHVQRVPQDEGQGGEKPEDDSAGRVVDIAGDGGRSGRGRTRAGWGFGKIAIGAMRKGGDGQDTHPTQCSSLGARPTALKLSISLLDETYIPQQGPW